MLLGAAIFPETSKYGGGPEKMAIVAVRQRWRRCFRGGGGGGGGGFGGRETYIARGLRCVTGRKTEA